MDDREAMDRIHAIMTGVEWSADTLEAIGEVVNASGRAIAGPDDDERI